MARTNTPVLLLPFAALLAVVFPFAFSFRQSSVPLSQETSKPKPARIAHTESKPSNSEGKDLSPEKHNANRILSQYFGVADYRSPLPKEDVRGTYSVDFMIVTVPDPIDSRLPHLFDRFLGSIERGAEADGLVLDRFDLPWVDEQDKRQAAKAEEAIPAPSTDSAADTHDHLKEPGLLLFREPLNKDRPRLCLVFVVGETPTGGVEKDAFLSALRQIDALSTVKNQKNPRIRILGPSFSGSAESLQNVLLNWLEEQGATQTPGNRRSIQIVSGSATAVSIAPPSTTAKNPHQYYFDLQRFGADTTFETTVVNDDVALDSFFAYLSSKHPFSCNETIRVGLLTEGNTSYGNSLSLTPRLFRTPKNAPSKEAVAVNKPLASPAPGSPLPSRSAGSSASGCFVGPSIIKTSLPFPLHISQLRSELEKARAQQNQNSQSPTQNSDSSKYLPVPFVDENAASGDAIPPFSQLETPTSELILANLLSTISNEHFDYVGIAATDVRDTIFLAREVRQHSPSSVLFSLNADLLYAHPEASPNTRGMLIITPYPLFTLNQIWTKPPEPDDIKPRPRLQFPDQASEGVYNAMLLLLGDGTGSPDDKLMEYGVPFRGLSDVANSSSAMQPRLDKFRVPPVWLTTVGRGGFWPITLLPMSDQRSSAPTHPSAVPTPLRTSDWSASVDSYSQGTMPHGTILVFSIWTLFCAIPAISFLRNEFQLRFLPSPNFLCGAVLDRSRGECSNYFLIGGSAALSAYIVAISAFVIDTPRIWELSLRSCFFFVMIGVAGLALCACLRLARYSIGRSGVRKVPGEANGYLSGPVLLVSIFGLLLTFWVAFDWLQMRYQFDSATPFAVNGLVTGYRALNLASGVSPLVPIFLIALAACAWTLSAVRRVRLAESLPWMYKSECDKHKDIPGQQDENCLFNSKKISFAGFSALEQRVQQLLRSPSLHLPGELRWISFITAGSAGIVVFYLFFFRLVAAFETLSFYVFFGFCFLVVYLAIAFNTLRLLFLWTGLSRLLRAIERHRLRRAFPRFFKNYPNLPRINLASAPSSLTALSFSVEQAQELLRASRASLPSGLPLAAVVVRETDKIANATRLHRVALAAETSKERCTSLIAQLKAQRTLARVSCSIEDALSCSWNTAFPVLSQDSASEEANKLTEQAEEFLVGRTVHFLSHIFPQMTNLAGFSLASLLLLLMAVSSYPFQPHQLIVLFSWIIISAFVGVALFMSVQMNRDTLLSNLNGTKPGELSWDREFVSRILLYVVIPILGFLGVQFPDTIAQLFSFLSPGASGHG